MNFIKTFLLIIVVFICLYLIFGIVISLIVGSIFSVLLFKWNIYSSTTGLIKLVLKIYYHARTTGLNHKDAIESVIKFRTRGNNEYNYVMDSMSKLIHSKSTFFSTDLFMVTYIILQVESRSDDNHNKIFHYLTKKFNIEYDKVSEKFENLDIIE